MSYSLSTEQFKKTFRVETGFKHLPGTKFNLFPYTTTPGDDDLVEELNGLTGYYLSRIVGKEAINFSIEELIEVLKKECEIAPGTEEIFTEVVMQLFFEAEKLRPTNLKALIHTPCTINSERKIAYYLVDVLGDSSVLRNSVEEVIRESEVESNVLERFVTSKLELRPILHRDNIPFCRITNTVQTAFEEDFKYILKSRSAQDYLISLLEFYYFIYTAQACLQLDRFMEGDRELCIPLYFCLEWERTSQSRECYTRGWRLLQDSVKRIFTHANVLEILNQTVEQMDPIDYIRLNELTLLSDEEDARIAMEIKEITELYRKSIRDCPEMDALMRKGNNSGSKTALEVKFLFDNINCQFEYTGRRARYTAYAAKFEKYGEKFLKYRGRSGKMLNISEELLIFLTKICIKDQEKMRLIDVFKEFEVRGVFLDDISKEQVMYYYEKLNLIEKKSDSGDAQYVKRIL